MKKVLTAVAVATAFPAVVYAQSAPATGKTNCCDQKDMADCSKSMGRTMGDYVPGMDTSKMDHSMMGHDMSKQSPAQPPEQHQNHQQ